MEKVIAKHALIPIAAGVATIGLVVFLEESLSQDLPPGHLGLYSIVSDSMKFFDHLGIAFLSLGVIGLLLDLPHLHKHFYGLFVDAITNEAYIEKRSKDKDWLEDVRTKVTRAFFGTKDIEKEGNFFSYHRAEIQKFIGMPYRDQYVGITKVEYLNGDKNVFKVTEDISFRCCKLGDRIADSVNWTAHEDELIDMPCFQITLTATNGEPKPFTIPPDQLRPNKEDRDWGHQMSLEDYKDMDGLKIDIHLEYHVNADRGFSTNMYEISKDLKWTIQYPSELIVHIDRFVLKEDSIKEDKSVVGQRTFEYREWLLPGDGFAFQFQKAQAI